jgi:hypothetical protein
MMADRGTFEVWLVVDSYGDYEVGTTDESALELFADNIGATGPLALYRLSVSAPLPRPREATITLADDAPVKIVVEVEESDLG